MSDTQRDTPQSPPAQSDPMVGVNGWPDPARPGVPLNPETDGDHWLVEFQGGQRLTRVRRWEGEWETRHGFRPADHFAYAQYLGPVARPVAAIAALRRDTPAAGGGTGEAMREACAKAVEDMIYGGHCGEERDEARDRNRRNDVLRAVARALRALPTPDRAPATESSK